MIAQVARVALPAAVLGAAFAVLYFAGLRANAALYLRDGRRAWAVGLHAVRVVAAAAFFVAIARLGAAALLAAFAGFLVVRHAATWTGRRA